MQRTVKVVSLIKVAVLVLVLVAAYALGRYQGSTAGYEAGADETSATYVQQMATLPK